MKNIISPVKELIREEIVNDSFLSYLDQYIIDYGKNVNRKQIKNLFHSQQQVNFAFDELSKHFIAILSKEVKQITEEIISLKKEDEIDFNDFIHVNYKELTSMFVEKKLIKPAPFNFEDPEFTSDYILHIMKFISFYVQNKFVIPLLNFIENNYIIFLMDDCVFPFQVEKLMKVIDKHNLVFETLHNDEPKSKKFSAVYSERNDCSYYLSYNKFVDLFSYNKHLVKVVNEFEEYINLTTQNIEGAYEKINLLNQIRLRIKCSILLFTKLPKSNTTVKNSLPQYARNDTHAIYNQLIIESFQYLKVVQFNPCLVDFQDLQHSIAKGAYVFIKTKLWMLEESLEFKNEESKSLVYHNPQKVLDHKIKTKLTVPQLSFLSKCLYEENDILEEKNKTALRKTIASCFTSKRKEDISTDSIRINFNSPDEKTIEFWIEKFTHMMQFAKNERENNRS